MGPRDGDLTHRGTATSWAVLDAARRHGWWADPLLHDVPPSQGSSPDVVAAADEVDRVVDVLDVGTPGPYVLGLLYEALLHPDDRSAGAHYTPTDVARRLCAEALGEVRSGELPLVWDPTCGGGAFLLAAADVLGDVGFAPATIVTQALWGTDVDPGAVAVADASLRWWAALHDTGLVDPPPDPNLGPGPKLEAADVFVRGCPVPGGCDVVVGNPPFQSQLRGRSVRSPERTAELRERWGDVVGPYTDTAALAMVVGASSLRSGGRLAMVLPISVLGARDAAAARAAVTSGTRLAGLWVAAEPVFAAEVEVCAVVLEAPPSEKAAADEAVERSVRRWRGRGLVPLPEASPPDDGRTWAPLAAAALGIPEPEISAGGTVGDLAEVSAGFRDEYYGLVGHVREAPEGFDVNGPAEGTGGGSGFAPLITSGLIQPGRVAWGERTVRFAKVDHHRPAVDLGSLHREGNRASRWVAATSVPKVLIATQTRVGEAAVDETGRWVASTPVVAAAAPVEHLWRLAAVICSPVGSALAAARTAGTARTGRSIKHSVASVRDLPLPVDEQAWDAGAAALRDGLRDEFVAAMADAYRVTDAGELDGWWRERVPWPVARR